MREEESLIITMITRYQIYPFFNLFYGVWSTTRMMTHV